MFRRTAIDQFEAECLFSSHSTPMLAKS